MVHHCASPCLEAWAETYISRGLAVAGIVDQEKRPTQRDWTLRSEYAHSFRDQYANIGIMCGRLSGDLVCIDLDSFEALKDADQFLPKTGMIEGRPGKPKSHRYFRVTHIIPEFTAMCAGGMGGPCTLQFTNPATGERIIDFLGTGNQANAPPTIWTSKDRSRQETREWDELGEPLLIDHAALLKAVAELARRHGGVNARWEKFVNPPAKSPRKKTASRQTGYTNEDIDIPDGEAVRQARRYVQGIPGAVEGRGGDRLTFEVACHLVVDFGLSVEDALPLFLEWNSRCTPPWPVDRLVYKLSRAEEVSLTKGKQVGGKVRNSRAIDVHVLEDEPDVVVGVGAAASGAKSYVTLGPCLWAAMLYTNGVYLLYHDLEQVNWAGKFVHIAAPSTIRTNSKIVHDLYQLSQLLREKGARVDVYCPRSPDGRGVTIADDVEVEVLTPPRDAEEFNLADRNARELAKHWKGRKRNKKSPKMDVAVKWLVDNQVMALSPLVVARAKEEGVARRTLERALSQLKNQHPLKENTSPLLSQFV